MKKIKILAVNDLTISLKILEIEVEGSDLPIEIDIASDGDEAVEKIQEGKKYDVILMNLEMPFMSGWQATGKIREFGVTVPIIAWSGHFKDLFMERCLKAGMNDYIEIDGFTQLKDIVGVLRRVGVTL